jgi:hypothetical protein
MIEDPRINQIHSLVSGAVKDAYERGRRDALDAVVKAAIGQTGGVDISNLSRPAPPIQVVGEKIGLRKRAPRGSVGIVIRRALDANPDGATLHQIMDSRKSEGELLMADSSIRGELRRDDGMVYKKIGDRWFYANDSETPQMQTAPDVNQGAAANVFE